MPYEIQFVSSASASRAARIAALVDVLQCERCGGPAARTNEVRFGRALAELYKNCGITEVASQKTARAIHINAIQPWKVDRDGSVHDAMFS